MSIGTPINERIREDLKNPVGNVIPDTKVTRDALEPFFRKEGFRISVGDRTTERLHELGFSPDLEIVDSLEKRKNRPIPTLIDGEERKILVAKNPPGEVSADALEKISLCLKLISSGSEKLRLEIRGEEDLLALPVIAFYPEGTTIFYGQPNVGMVVVHSEKSRVRSRMILAELGIRSLPDVTTLS
jgi:GTP-dependent dephospho-CoA kinase